MESSDNIKRLRELVDELDQDKNHKTLNKIETIIKEERVIINKLKRSDVKIKHYETICSSIMALISTNV
jgi:hypothetical protein